MEETFLNLIVELLRAAAGHFDLSFMLLFFVSNLALLKMTVLSRKRKVWKQTFVVIYGICLGLAFLTYHYSVYGINESVKHSVKIGISMFSTMLFYDLVYKIIREKLKTFIEVRKEYKRKEAEK